MMMDFATLFELPVTKLYPWCDFSHCLLTAFQAKKDFKELHRQRPVTSLLLTMILCSAGSLLTDLLLQLNPLVHFNRPDKLLMGFITWVLVACVPFIVSAISTSPLQGVAVLFKEIYRLRKVVRGVQMVEDIKINVLSYTHHSLPGHLLAGVMERSLLMHFLVGMAKGNGSGLLRPVLAGYLNSEPPSYSKFFTTSTILTVFLSAVWLLCEQYEVSRDLSYPSLLLVLLTAKFSSILDVGGLTLVSRNKNEVAKDSAREVDVGDERDEEVKEAQMQDKETEAQDNLRNQNNVISGADDNQSKELK